MKRLLAAGAAVLCMAAAAPAHSQPNVTPHAPDCSADRFRSVARIAYQPWYRPVTKRHQLHRLKVCAPNTRTRTGMNRIHRNMARGRWDAIRAYRALTPYPACGGHRAAVPGYIVWRESRCQWSAYNASSGALGWYQFLGWSVPWPVDSIQDRMAHHQMAAELWDGGAGCSNWTAC